MEGGCLKIAYSGASASCLLVGNATAKTLTSLIGAAGSESVDSAFGTAGVIDLTGATVDTLAELAAVIDAYANYSCTILYGDDIPTSEILNSQVQAKGTYGYVLFNRTSVLDTDALTSWARTKLFLDLKDSDQTLAEYLINSATDAAESVSGRLLKARTLTKDLDGPGSNMLLLPLYPITSVATVYHDSARSFGSTTLLVEGTDYLVYEDEGYLHHLGSGWGDDLKATRVTWTGGMATVDARLQDAAIEV
ncbi:MAG: hypothetical protein FJX72_20835, partial [Armatimonadetes bacterium]|nr:hypothetical protein [Armatimonadota bacterium]